MNNILITGGSGTLGTELKKYFPRGLFPTHSVLDITDIRKVNVFFKTNDFNEVIHTAAYISPPKIDKNPQEALQTNILGTANIVQACLIFKKKLVYISTDYVFNGKIGDYKEDDPIFPCNKYAWSKLGGECCVRLMDNYLIIRTSFGPDVFPYQKAFIDQYTSREPVSIVARKISTAVKKGFTGTLHIGGKRRTVFDYASSIKQERTIIPISIGDVNFSIPKDTSLNTDRYKSLISDEKK